MSELKTALAAAREKLASIEINRICSVDHAEKLLREDVLRIFDAMAATLPTACPNLRVGERTAHGEYAMWCALAEQPTDYLKGEDE